MFLHTEHLVRLRRGGRRVTWADIEASGRGVSTAQLRGQIVWSVLVFRRGRNPWPA